MKRRNVEDNSNGFLKKYGRAILLIFVVGLLVHDVFGTHGFLAMQRTKKEIVRVQADLDRLNKENERLADEVTALKTDPHKIEKIARDELGLAKKGEVIIKIPADQQPQADPKSPR